MIWARWVTLSSMKIKTSSTFSVTGETASECYAVTSRSISLLTHDITHFCTSILFDNHCSSTGILHSSVYILPTIFGKSTSCAQAHYTFSCLFIRAKSHISSIYHSVQNNESSCISSWEDTFVPIILDVLSYMVMMQDRSECAVIIVSTRTWLFTDNFHCLMSETKLTDHIL